MSKNKIDFSKFEVIKEGNNQIKGGETGNASNGNNPIPTPIDVVTPASQPTIPPTILPSACDQVS